MHESLLVRVVQVMPELFTELLYVVTHHEVTPEHFGNEEIQLRSPELRLSFLRDRGPITIGIGSAAYPDDDWHSLSSAEWLMHDRELREDLSFEAQIAFLQAHHAIIAELFGKEQFPTNWDRLQNREEEFARQYWGHVPPYIAERRPKRPGNLGQPQMGDEGG